MKKHEILYDWPVGELTRMADSDVAEGFYATLAEPALSAFVRLAEQMRGLGADIARAKADRAHFLKWAELLTCIEQFEKEFPAFPNAASKKFRVFAMLADKVAKSAPTLDADNIDENLFVIRELPATIPLLWFSRENAQSFADSLVVFSSADMPSLELKSSSAASLENAIAAANISPRLLFHFLAALGSLADLPQRHAALAKNVAPQPDIAVLDAFAKLAILASGEPIHTAHPHLAPPCVIDPDSIRFGASYHQWNDVIHVLSEYNSRDELLLKYLTIYHVVENFMFKLPIVDLERQQSGRMFSIRDFRRLYEHVDMNESDALKQLFIVILQMQASPGVTFQQHITARWNALVPGIAQADIDKALGVLGLAFRFNGFQAPATAGCFSKLVYAIRNAIVHNKETEFHLTYASLDANVCSLIEVFLIPALEEICFALVGSPNTQLWYQNKELLLYK